MVGGRGGRYPSPDYSPNERNRVSNTWVNTVCELELPSAHSEAFMERFMVEVKPPWTTIGMSSIAEADAVLHTLRITVVEDEMDAPTLWVAITEIADAIALDGLDMCFAKFSTEYAWSRE